MASQSQNTPTVPLSSQQTAPKNIWKLLWIVIAAFSAVGGILWMFGSDDKENPMYPPDLVEKQIPAFSPKIEDTLGFDFNSERMLFKPGERRKDILADTAYSPKIVIPWGVNWHLETLDSIDVWFKDGDHIWVYPKMKPIDVKKKVAIYRFKSRYSVTIWLD